MDWILRGDAPIYTQLVEQIKQAIVSGVFAPGERLLAVRDLAAEAGVNPNTMQRALAELEREGLVFSLRTTGRYVTEDRGLIQRAGEDLAQEEIREFFAAMARLGYDRGETLQLLQQEGE